MKTSTKNTIIGGVFTVIAAIIGTISFSKGKEVQGNIIEAAISKSGIITINQDESSSEIIDRLLDEYVKLQNDYNNIFVEYTDLKNEYDSLNQTNEMLNVDKNELKEELNHKTEEIEKLMSQISESDSSDLKEDINNNPIFIKNIVKDDSYYYKEQERFVDNFGNTYPLVYRFDASNNAFAKFSLNQKYSILTGNITLSKNTGNNALMIVEIYGDNYELLKRVENISKSSMSAPISLGNIDVSEVNKLTINAYNSGDYPDGFLYLTDVELQ